MTHSVRSHASHSACQAYSPAVGAVNPIPCGGDTRVPYPGTVTPRLRSVLAATVLVLTGCHAAPAPSLTLSPSGEPSSPTPTTTPVATPTGDLAGCTDGEIVPSRIHVPSLKIDEPVLSLGLTKSGSVDAPPLSQLMTAGWYNGSPKPGSAQGHVVMTAHTTIRSGATALGNLLMAGLTHGAVIRLSDASGKTVCFRYADRKKIWVREYTNDSTDWINDNGPARLALLTCDDYNKRTKEFDSRWILYADLVKVAQ